MTNPFRAVHIVDGRSVMVGFVTRVLFAPEARLRAPPPGQLGFSRPLLIGRRIAIGFAVHAALLHATC